MSAHAPGDRFGGDRCADERHDDREPRLAASAKPERLRHALGPQIPFERHRQVARSVWIAEQPVGLEAAAVEGVIPQDGLPHEEHAIVVGATRQADDAIDVTRRREDRLAKPPAAEVLAAFRTPADVSPKPIEIFAAPRLKLVVGVDRGIAHQATSVKVFVDEPADLGIAPRDRPRDWRREDGEMGLEAGQVIDRPGRGHRFFMERESDADWPGADAGVEGVLDRFPDEGGDMTIVELVVARADEELFLERIGLDRTRRSLCKLPRQLRHESCCHACHGKQPCFRSRRLRPFRASRSRRPSAIARLPQCQGGAIPGQTTRARSGDDADWAREEGRRARARSAVGDLGAQANARHACRPPCRRRIARPMALPQPCPQAFPR